MAVYREKFKGSDRRRGEINPYLQDLRLRGYNVTSAEFWKVVKRYERYSKKLTEANLSPINPFAEAEVYFTNNESALEIKRVMVLGKTDRKMVETNTVLYDFKEFVMAHASDDFIKVGGSLEEWNTWLRSYTKDLNAEFRSLDEITLNDIVNRYRTDSKFNKKDFYKVVEKIKKSPKGLASGS